MPKEKIDPVSGWFLIGREDKKGPWHICWIEPFSTKNAALAFAKENGWQQPYRAARGLISVTQ